MTQIATPQITRLPHRALIRISGPDWASFLKGLCTAYIDEIVAEGAEGVYGRLHYGAFLRPQGKLICDCLLQLVAADDIWLDVAASVRDELLAKLNMYKLRAKVMIEALDAPVYVAFDGDLPDGFATDPRASIIDAPFGLAYGKQTDTTDVETWDAYRMAYGLSDPGADFDADDLYAIDANLDLLHAIDFHKGCYVGQELTSRMKRRGQIKNRILPFAYKAEAPERGSEILNGDKRAGEVLLAGHGVGLALMRIDRRTGSLSFGATPIDLIIPDWIAPHLPAPETT